MLSLLQHVGVGSIALEKQIPAAANARGMKKQNTTERAAYYSTEPGAAELCRDCAENAEFASPGPNLYFSVCCASSHFEVKANGLRMGCCALGKVCAMRLGIADRWAELVLGWAIVICAWGIVGTPVRCAAQETAPVKEPEKSEPEKTDPAAPAKEEPKPTETKPTETTSTEAKPAEAGAAGVKSEETKPADPQAEKKTDEPKAEEKKPEEVKSGEQKPAESSQSPEALAELKRQNEMQSEKAKLQLEYELLMQRQRSDLAKSELQVKEIEAKVALEKAKLEGELAAMRREMERISTEASLDSARRNRAMESLKLETELLSSESGLLQQKLMKLKTEADIAMLAQQAELSKMARDASLADGRKKANDRITKELSYKQNPLEDGILYISDRRVALNGVITQDSADYVAERVQFYNNQSSEKPIFIVIDYSPGGSVMAGYRILSTIKESKAPCHVVVKSFAASMAAIITTLADESYAYPNAILLHHQMSSMMFGNLTQQREQLDVANEWATRLMNPLCAKLGYANGEAFVKDMYANNSDGDWELFADKAKDRKWVNHVIREVREESVDSRPQDGQKSPISPITFDEVEKDENGNRFVRLPRLRPFDFYLIHNPDNYYRF